MNRKHYFKGDDLNAMIKYVSYAISSANPSNGINFDIFEYIMTDSELEQYLLDRCLWYAEHTYMNNEEAIAYIMERWYPDDTNEISNIKNSITETVEAYKLVENLKDNQVDIYNDWLENQKKEYPDLYSYEDEI